MPSKKFLDKKVSEIRKIQEYKLTDVFSLLCKC